jgi:hypothetical protein
LLLPSCRNTGRAIRHDQLCMPYNPSDYAQELMERPFARVENQYE